MRPGPFNAIFQAFRGTTARSTSIEWPAHVVKVQGNDAFSCLNRNPFFKSNEKRVDI
jgi:hypothetical protein